MSALMLAVACAPPSAGVTFEEPPETGDAADDTGSTGSSTSLGPSASDPSNPGSSDPSDATDATPGSSSGVGESTGAESTTGPPAPVNLIEWEFGSVAYAFNDPNTAHHDGFGAEGQCSAAWIERSDGTFVKTLMKLGEIEDFHLIAWRAASGDNVVDAITGPTPPVATSYFHSGTWDLTDVGGVQVPDGDYVLQLEFTEENSGDGAPWGPGPRKSVPFTLGAGPFDHMPSDDGLYDSVRCYGHE